MYEKGIPKSLNFNIIFYFFGILDCTINISNDIFGVFVFTFCMAFEVLEDFIKHRFLIF